MKKKILKSICLGLGLGVLLCCLFYAGITLYYKDILETSVEDKKSKEEEFENGDELIHTNSENKEPILRSDEANKAVMTAADTLVPQKVEKLFVIKAPTMQVINAQGGCVIGEYVYQAFYFADVAENQANNECMIVKCELKTGKVVQTSEILQLNHVNDITYNEKIGYLVVAHNQPMANLISYVNVDTLEVVDTFPIDLYVYCIAYNAARNQYVAGIQGSKNFCVLDADFKQVSDVYVASSRCGNSITQGNDCDDDYIYFTLYKPNIVVVYDWDGNFVTLIELNDIIPPEDYEPENLTVVDGEIYVNCGQRGATIFKISDFIPKQEEAKEE